MFFKKAVLGIKEIIASLTEENKETISRLQKLGDFFFHEVCQIFQVSDKNEKPDATFFLNRNE